MKLIKYSIITLTGIFVLSNNAFRKLIKNHLRLNEMNKKSISLDKEYLQMVEEKKLLKEDKYLEKVARLELHLTKPNEYEFRFSPPEVK